MILIMKILLHNEYKIISLRYPTYVYQFLIFLIITKIECWPVFKQDPPFLTTEKQSHAIFPLLCVSLGAICPHGYDFTSSEQQKMSLQPSTEAWCSLSCVCIYIETVACGLALFIAIMSEGRPLENRPQTPICYKEQ